METPNENNYLALWKHANCKYTSCYCEENIYLLCKDFVKRIEEKNENQDFQVEAFAVFITNNAKKAEIRCQKAGKSDPYNTVVW